jgi:para-aminobenzoate synthetase component I
VPDELLEIRDAASAFATIDEWLAARGFFASGREDHVADVYLGYGLSQSIRRVASPPLPEPCPALPLAACRIRPAAPLATDCYKDALAIGAWERTWSEAEYRLAVDEVRAAIARGDVYQVNLVQHLEARFAGDPRALQTCLAGLRPLHPEAFVTDDWAVVTASPELFLARRGDRIWTMPIKGTRPRGGAAELRASEKDAAEHVMIVDLERNDLSRVCEPGTVHWPELMATRELAGVEHMVSTVEGTLREGVGLAEILKSTFPGGSVTGAPKIAAVDLIAQLEPVGRGASMGAIGRIHGNGDFDLALTIRTFAIADGAIHLWVGGGIVWDSDPATEVEESWVKARPLLQAVGAPLPEVALV